MPASCAPVAVAAPSPDLSSRLGRPRWWALAAAAAVVVGVLTWAVVAALAARARIDATRADLGVLTSATHGDQVLLQRRLAADERRLSDAAGWMNGWGPRFVAALPVVGRSFVAERTVAGTSRDVVGAARVVLADAASVGRPGGGGVDLVALRRLQTDVDQAAGRLRAPVRRLDSLRTAWTPPFVSHAVGQARDRLDAVPGALASAASMAGAARDLLGEHGPRTLLIALQNNAELRGTGGLVAAVTAANGRDGRLEVGPIRDVTTQLSASPGFTSTVPAPPDYVATYGAFGANTTIWTNANFSPDVPDSATVLSRLMERTTKVHVDGVVFVDVPAMAAIVDALGRTVTLPSGKQVRGQELGYDLTVQSYGPAATTSAEQTKRRLQLEHIAGDVLRDALGQRPSLSLILALAEQVGGRHIAVWSADPAVEHDLVDAGAGGEIRAGSGGDLATVTVDNLGDSPGNGNKLDYYAQRSLTVDVTLSRHQAIVRQTLRLRNAAPDGLGSYVEGPEHPGRLHELVGLAFARTATVDGFSVDGQPGAGQIRPLQDAQQLLTDVTLGRGQSTTLVLQYRLALPAGRYTLAAIPQPLVNPAELTIRLHSSRQIRLRPRGSSGSRPWTSTRRLVATT